MSDFSCLVIDEICCEWGPPEYVVTDDGEAWYWRFPGHDLPVADNLSELFLAALQLKPLAVATPSQPEPVGTVELPPRVPTEEDFDVAMERLDPCSPNFVVGGTTQFEVMRERQLLAALSQLAAKDAVIAELEKEMMYFRARIFSKSSRYDTRIDHSSACTIWGDDGMGGTKEKYPEPLPCNCGALINWEKRTFIQLEQQLSDLREEKEQQLMGEKAQDRAEVYMDRLRQADMLLSRASAVISGATTDRDQWRQDVGKYFERGSGG